MAKGLLGLIARPSIASPSESFREGREEASGVQSKGLADSLIQQNLSNAQATGASSARKETEAINKVALGNSYSLIKTSSTFKGDKINQDEYLKMARDQAEKSGGVVAEKAVPIIDYLIGLPIGEREAAYERINSSAQQSGFFEKAPESTTEKTSTQEIREREIAVKEAALGLRKGELDARRKEIENEEKFGEVPTGYRRTEDGSVEVIPGSPAERKEIDRQKKIVLKYKAASQKAVLINTAIDEAMGRVNNMTTGFGGAFMENVPASEALELKEFILTLKSNMGFDKLQQMRESSPTGGALGNVSDREIASLQAVLTSLSTRQKPATLKKNLRIVRTFYDKYLKDMGEMFSDDPNSQNSSGETTNGVPVVNSKKDFDKLPSGAVFTEDGIKYRKP